MMHVMGTGHQTHNEEIYVDGFQHIPPLPPVPSPPFNYENPNASLRTEILAIHQTCTLAFIFIVAFIILINGTLI